MTALSRTSVACPGPVPAVRLGRHRPHLRDQQRRRQHPRHRSGDQQGRPGVQGPRGDARRGVFARRRAGLCQQRGANDPRRVRAKERQAHQAGAAEQPAEQHRRRQGRPHRRRHRPRRRRARYHRPGDADAQEVRPGPRPAAQRLCHAGQQICHHRLDPESFSPSSTSRPRQIAWELKLSGGVRPMAIETNPDGSTKRIFAQLSDLNGFAVVDFADRKEAARVELPKTTRQFETDSGREFRAVARHRRHPGQQDPVGDQHPEQRGVRLFARRPEDGRRRSRCRRSSCRATRRSRRWPTGSPSRRTARRSTCPTPGRVRSPRSTSPP